jgi:hypothetical protein
MQISGRQRFYKHVGIVEILGGEKTLVLHILQLYFIVKLCVIYCAVWH